MFVLEQRERIWAELDQAGESVRNYLKETFFKLLSHPSIFEWIDAYTERAATRATRRIIDALRVFVL